MASTLNKKAGMMPSFNLNDSIQKTRNSFKMGGKIGIETLIQSEQFYLAEYMTHEILKAAASERLRKNADLRMDWITTVELVVLHYVIYAQRLSDMDMMGHYFIDMLGRRLYHNMNERRKEMEIQ